MGAFGETGRRTCSEGGQQKGGREKIVRGHPRQRPNARKNKKKKGEERGGKHKKVKKKFKVGVQVKRRHMG